MAAIRLPCEVSWLCLCCVSLLQSLADTWWFGGQELPDSESLILNRIKNFGMLAEEWWGVSTFILRRVKAFLRWVCTFLLQADRVLSTNKGPAGKVSWLLSSNLSVLCSTWMCPHCQSPAFCGIKGFERLDGCTVSYFHYGHFDRHCPSVVKNNSNNLICNYFGQCMHTGIRLHIRAGCWHDLK